MAIRFLSIESFTCPIMAILKNRSERSPHCAKTIYMYIYSFKNSMKPDKLLIKTVKIKISWFLWKSVDPDLHFFYTTCEFIIITKYEIQNYKFILTCPRTSK